MLYFAEPHSTKQLHYHTVLHFTITIVCSTEPDDTGLYSYHILLDLLHQNATAPDFTVTLRHKTEHNLTTRHSDTLQILNYTLLNSYLTTPCSTITTHNLNFLRQTIAILSFTRQDNTITKRHRTLPSQNITRLHTTITIPGST